MQKLFLSPKIYWSISVISDNGVVIAIIIFLFPEKKRRFSFFGEFLEIEGFSFLISLIREDERRKDHLKEKEKLLDLRFGIGIKVIAFHFIFFFLVIIIVSFPKKSRSFLALSILFCRYIFLLLFSFLSLFFFFFVCFSI